MGTNDWLKGAVIGGIAGVIAGVLLAPKSGVENRAELCEALDVLVEKAQGNYDKALDELHGFAGKSIDNYGDQKERLKNAFAAAVKAYKEELGEKPKEA